MLLDLTTFRLLIYGPEPFHAHHYVLKSIEFCALSSSCSLQVTIGRFS